MSYQLLEGKPIADSIAQEIKASVEKMAPKRPLLVAVAATKHPSSLIYLSKKVAACREVGIQSRIVEIEPKDTAALIQLIDSLNKDSEVHGILIQLPLPSHIDSLQVLQRVDPMKDVDGFHPINIGKVLIHDTTAFYPCTPLGIQVLLQKSGISIEGSHVVIVGRSTIVGKPLAAMLMQNAPGCNATVTVAHSKSRDLASLCRSADILVSAVGKPGTITQDMVREGCVVVDVGINRVEDSSRRSGYRLVGDVDFDAVAPKCKAITPVPGGVGPMTIAMLLQNTVKSAYGFLNH